MTAAVVTPTAAREIIGLARLAASLRVDDEALASAALRLGELVSPC